MKQTNDKKQVITVFMKKIPLLIVALAVLILAPNVFAEEYPQELYISPKGEITMRGAEIIFKHALNLYTARMWKQKWLIEVDNDTKFESADGISILPEELSAGHFLDIQGKIMTVSYETNQMQARLVRDLAIKKSTSSPAVLPIIITPLALAPSTTTLPLTTPLSIIPQTSPPPAKQAAVLLEKSVEETAKPSTLTQDISLGAKGERVVLLQEFLQKNDWGIPNDGPVTGFFGAVTRNALRKFQKANNLEPTGIVDSKTMELIESLSSKQQTVSSAPLQKTTGKKVLTQHLRLKMKGDEVVVLQEFLQKNDWGIPSDGPVTGYFGKATKKALINFQESNGIEAIGEVGPQTRELINSLLNK